MNLIIAGFLPIRHEADLFNLSRLAATMNCLSLPPLSQNPQFSITS
jgi:hypothetical protein